VNDPASPTVTEVVNMAMHAYKHAVASKPKLNSTSEIVEAIK
jgi:hypothetical protein